LELMYSDVSLSCFQLLAGKLFLLIELYGISWHLVRLTWIWPQQYLVKISIRQQPHLAGVYFAPWGWWNIRWDYCQYGHSNMATLHGKYDDSPVNIRFLIWCQFSRSVRPRSNDNYDHILYYGPEDIVADGKHSIKRLLLSFGSSWTSHIHNICTYIIYTLW
jgi:hypothetical protein